MKTTILFYSLLLCSWGAWSQEEGMEHEKHHQEMDHQEHHYETHSHEEHNMAGAHRLTVGFGHTHVSEGKVDGKTQWLVLASWSLNYDYWLSNRWAVGLQSDIVLETFVIEDHENEIIERSYPVSLVPVAIYKVGNHLSVLGGVGFELAEERNLTMTRLGLEYGFHLPKSFEVGAALVWDGKWDYYNSWGLAITVSKIWRKEHH